MQIQAYMEHLKIGYEELAVRIDGSSYEIKAWEDGRKEISWTDLLALAFALGASTDDVLGESPWDAAPQTAAPESEDSEVSGYAGVARLRFADSLVRSAPLSASEMDYIHGVMLAENEPGFAGWALLQGFDDRLVAFHPEAIEHLDLVPATSPSLQDAGAPRPTALFEALSVADRSTLRRPLRAAVEALAAVADGVEVVYRDGTAETLQVVYESVRSFAMNEFDLEGAAVLELMDGTQRYIPEHRLAAVIMSLSWVMRSERERINE